MTCARLAAFKHFVVSATPWLREFRTTPGGVMRFQAEKGEIWLAAGLVVSLTV
jgi:hypothetical protein